MMEERNERARALILQIVENQMRDNTPPETNQTYQRLLKEGYSDQEARKLIGVVVTTEIFEVMKTEQPYDQARYIAALKKLPTLPPE